MLPTPKRLGWCAAALLAGLVFAPLAFAQPPTDREVADAEETQNKALGEARRGGSMAGVVTQAESRHLRAPTPLTLFLLGRAQFHAGDAAKAERSMREVVAQEPGFWQAHLRLGMLALEADDVPRAKQHLDVAASMRPRDTGVLRLFVEVAMRTKDYDGALRALRALQVDAPEAPGLKMGVAEILMLKADWPAAYAELRPLRLALANDPRVRFAYARAAFETKRLDEAILELEELAKNDPQGVPYLDLLRQAYFLKEDWTRLANTLERLLPYAKPADRADVEATVKSLRAGNVPKKGTAAPGAGAGTVVKLFERCLSSDVATRRQALQELHDANLGWLPGAVLMRYHFQEEPDPTCRAWVLRLVTALGNEQTVRVPGHALQDPSPLVRRVASESLGTLKTPAGLIYLLAYLPDLQLTADAPEATVAEFNAGRAALASITGRDDLPVGAPTWVAAADMEASWKRWEAWLVTPEGVQAKVRAIEDLIQTGETHPEWYLVLQIFDASPQVATAAYTALREVAKRPSNDAVAKKMWPLFPQATAEDLTVKGLPGLGARVKTWWGAWLAERKAEK
jgi:tetratricopeptide (TPR) repeat protein